MDRISTERRSRNMSAIRSKNTKPEVYLRHLLFKDGFRYRLHQKSVPGTPDLFFRKYNTALFVHGCFWHRHPGCSQAYMPKSNTEFWTSKFNKNIERDERQKSELKQMGVRVLIIWECTVKKMMKDPDYEKDILEKVRHFLTDSARDYLEL